MQPQQHVQGFQLVQTQPERLTEGIGPVRQLAFHFGALNLNGSDADQAHHASGEQQANRQRDPEGKSTFLKGAHALSLTKA